MTTTTLTENQIALRTAVTEHYLETGESADAATLAERLGWSATKVRRVMADGIDGVYSDEDRRASYSRNFRNYQSGAHRVMVYLPARGYLRTLLLEARKA